MRLPLWASANRGVPGTAEPLAELCLPLMLGLVRQGAIPLSRLIDALTRAPARIAGLDAPRIREGARADLVLVDPLARWTLDPALMRTKSRNTPFAGQAVQGRVEVTMCEGRIVHQERDAKASS